MAELDAVSSAVWRESSRSNGGGAQCVEVGFASGARGVRDSKLGEDSPVARLRA
ncbi:DUF397 domain-containing protein [Salinifilum aidingensis]